MLTVIRHLLSILSLFSICLTIGSGWRRPPMEWLCFRKRWAELGLNGVSPSQFYVVMVINRAIFLRVDEESRKSES
jgi:hypothetical protein